MTESCPTSSTRTKGLQSVQRSTICESVETRLFLTRTVKDLRAHNPLELTIADPVRTSTRQTFRSQR